MADLTVNTGAKAQAQSGTDIYARLRAMNLGTMPGIVSADPTYLKERSAAYSTLLKNAWNPNGAAASAEAMTTLRALNAKYDPKAKQAPAPVDKVEQKPAATPQAGVSKAYVDGEYFSVNVLTPDIHNVFSFDQLNKAVAFSTVATNQLNAGTLTPKSVVIIAEGVDKSPTLPTETPKSEPSTLPLAKPAAQGKNGFSVEVSDVKWLIPQYRMYRLSKFGVEKAIDAAKWTGEKLADAGRWVGTKAVEAKNAVVKFAGDAKDTIVSGLKTAGHAIAETASDFKDGVVSTGKAIGNFASNLWHKKLFTISFD